MSSKMVICHEPGLQITTSITLLLLVECAFFATCGYGYGFGGAGGYGGAYSGGGGSYGGGRGNGDVSRPKPMTIFWSIAA